MFGHSLLRTPVIAAAATIVAALSALAPATAETRVTYKSAKSTSSYYQMAVQLAEAMKAGTDGGIILTVEESQGSVQNVKEAARRGGNYVFTTPPGLIKLATAGKKMFEGDDKAAYEGLRSLFPIPYLTMHFVVRADTGITGFDGLAGHKFLIGKGSFGAREAEKYLKLFGIAEAVDLVDVELNAAVPALQNHQIDGFATAGSYPAPNVLEAAASVPVTLIGLTDEQVKETGRDRLVIPAGTYPGVDEPVTTTTLPVGAYTTAAMDEETAYTLTKTFWESKAKMEKAHPWWAGVTAKGLETLAAPIHPGAARYYKEAGIAVPDGPK
ncbi:TAXI family TRAP transporter solute-binding subunit [Kaustia mangrovi]|uniref:TAXI family TRAP transporter solute-binding subunit n=1 Tax=Kaustia mangrovi TaxID=2593653 RepID=A0A7S8C271_9HYPH|nr:TAXI family TRAP transporter solute-binding subunit [Kaustia mangrovi]QPC42025.1 TAXI family TRAP transporter solute-binding subunit [Kaustia mangrovi]